MTRPDDQFGCRSPLGNPPGDYAVDWAHRAGAVDEVLVELVGRERRQRRRRIALFSTALCAVMVLGFVFRAEFSSTDTTPAPNGSTLVSLPARQVLPDGSVVELKEGAEIEVAF